MICIFSFNRLTLKKVMTYSMAKKNETIILGIDPGTCVTGYGVIRFSSHTMHPIDYGCIKPPPHYPVYKRYLIIHEALEELIALHHPDSIALESQFVYKNAQSALKLGIAKGIAMLAALKRGLPVHEYAPKQAKLAVVGKGNASKEQVQKMMQLLLGLQKPPTPADAADALSLAICHAHHLKFQEKIHR
jgi:crossover junction endodeoxyribonuclease RuvC